MEPVYSSGLSVWHEGAKRLGWEGDRLCLEDGGDNGHPSEWGESVEGGWGG